jgi:glycosyltransferase involved in cell wall biosynthesis
MNQPQLPPTSEANSVEPSPLVSVITPTFNGSRFLKLALHTWQSFSYPNREWIIVDDGNEPSMELPNDARIKYIKLHEKHTIGQKRSIAVDNCAGEYIMCMDDDAFYPKNVIEHRLETLGTAECSFCSSIACFNFYEGISFINSPHTFDAPHKRVSEATLFFRRAFCTGEGEDAFIQGRYDKCRELDWQGIIIALIHPSNASIYNQPVIIPNGNHFINKEWGMTEEYVKLLETV